MTKKNKKPKINKRPRIKIDEYYKAGKINEFQKVALEKMVDHYEASQNLHNASQSSYELSVFINKNQKEAATLIKLSQPNFYQELKDKFSKKNFTIRIARNRYRKISGKVIFVILFLIFVKNMSRDDVRANIGISPNKLETMISKGLDYLLD